MTDATNATYHFKFPVEHGGKTYAEATFARMKVKDYAAADLFKGGTEKTAAMLASMSGIPVPVFKGMDIEDWLEVQEAAAPFMQALLDRIEAMAAKADAE